MNTPTEEMIQFFNNHKGSHGLLFDIEAATRLNGWILKGADVNQQIPYTSHQTIAGKIADLALPLTYLVARKGNIQQSLNTSSALNTLVYRADQRPFLAVKILFDLMIKDGAHINPPNALITPLMSASTPEMTELLLHKRAYVNTITRYGNALHQTTETYHTFCSPTPPYQTKYARIQQNMVKKAALLIDAGIDINALDKDGETPLDKIGSCWSPVAENDPMYFLLLKNGARHGTNQALREYKMPPSLFQRQHD